MCFLFRCCVYLRVIANARETETLTTKALRNDEQGINTKIFARLWTYGGRN
jgi:hypothetical protein